MININKRDLVDIFKVWFDEAKTNNWNDDAFKNDKENCADLCAEIFIEMYEKVLKEKMINYVAQINE